MSLTFTDDQLRTTSLDILDLPGEKSAADTSKQAISDDQAATLKKDQGYEVFYDFYHSIINSYHDELAVLNGTKKTNYDDATLISAAKQEQNNAHYPITPTVWTQLTPMVIPSNNGNPTTSVTNELGEIISFSTYEALLLSGFSTGATSDVTTTAFSGGMVNVSTGTFAVGQTVLIVDTGGAVYGTVSNAVTLVGPSAQQLTITVILSSGSPGVGASIKNFHAGYTNSDRTTGTVTDSQWFNLLLTTITGFVNSIQAQLNGQLTALNSEAPNDSTEQAEVATAKSNVNIAIAVITTWLTAASFGANGKWTDTTLNTLSASFTSRQTQVPARVGIINSRLGSVTQTPDGAYTGSGHYYNLFRWVDQRIALIGGTLLAYYDRNNGIAVFDKQKSLLNNRDSDYSTTLFVTRLSSNGDGTFKVVLDSLSKLLINDTIKLIADNLPIIQLQVVSLSPPNRVVEFNSAVPASYTRGGNGRIVKLL